MTDMIKKVPIPLSGVMLGVAALGNLLQSYSESLRYLCGVIAGILLILLVLKIILFHSDIKEDLKNPILLSVCATFPMAIMLLSVYLKPFIGDMAKIIWFMAIGLHIAIMILFTYRFIIKLDMQKVFASYFIVYVGIAVVGITSPAYSMQKLGNYVFYFAFVCLLLLMALVGYRYLKYRDIPEPARPLVCIFGAPFSLCLASYMQCFEVKTFGLVASMAVLSISFYVVALVCFFSLRKLKFYPSYASYTFPFVISAIAMKQTTGYLNAIQRGLSFMPYIVLFQTIVAGLLVTYTLCRFILIIFSSPKVNKNAGASIAQ